MGGWVLSFLVVGRARRKELNYKLYAEEIELKEQKEKEEQEKQEKEEQDKNEKEQEQEKKEKEQLQQEVIALRQALEKKTKS